MTALITVTKKLKKKLLLISAILISVIIIGFFAVYLYEEMTFKTELVSDKPISDGFFITAEKIQEVGKKTELELLCQIEWFNSAAASAVLKQFLIKKKLEDCFAKDFFKDYKAELTQKLKSLSEEKEVTVFGMIVKPEINAIIAATSNIATKLGNVQRKVKNPEYIGPPIPPQKPQPMPGFNKKSKNKTK